MGVFWASVTTNDDASTLSGKSPPRLNSLTCRIPPARNGASTQAPDELDVSHARTRSAVQAVSLDRLAPDAADEPDAVAFAEVQLALPHVQHLDEARGRADSGRMGQGTRLTRSGTLLVHDQWR